MFGWLLLVAAILAEVAATTAIKLSDGFSRLLPSVVVVVVGYGVSFALLSVIVQRGIGLAVVYAIWSGCGIALIALIGAFWLDQPLSLVQVGGLALIAAGIVALQSGVTS